MKRIRICKSVFPVLLFACCIASGYRGSAEQGVRPPAFAGQFYSANAARLKLAVEKFIDDAVPAKVDKPVAIIAPHAGYIYSGQICADAWRQVKDHSYDTIVIVGTNHTAAGFDRISIYSRGAYRTPLGEARVDEETAVALLEADPDCTPDTAPHAKEHSVEVQVPFAQVLFPKARIVPVVIGAPDSGMCRRFGEALAGVLKNRQALIVASSDLSHFPPYEDAVRVDRQTLEAVSKLDPEEFRAKLRSLMAGNVSNLQTCACGEGPIMAAMTAAKSLGAARGVIVSYANTADAMVGARDRVVGYGAVVLAADPGTSDSESLVRPDAPPPEGLSSAEKRALLEFSRKSLLRVLSTETLPSARNLPPRLHTLQGAFVTLKKDGLLRGCIGHMAADAPLGQTVGVMTIEAALNDTRFSQVTMNEVPNLEVEISVLTPMKKVAGPKDIVVGRDGVLIRKDGRSAVFLPQVATEMGWDYSEMLDNLCLKAGLPRDGWKEGAEFLVFQAEVFSESEFR